MREKHQEAVAIAPMTVEEYIRYEWTAECRHEYINGKLFEMPGDKDTSNEVAGNVAMLFYERLKARGYDVYRKDVKVSNGDRTKYFYPDVFVTKEAKTGANEYIKYEPELIAEVIAPKTRITDTVDKYIDYTAIPSLKYYLIVEPEVIYITVYAKGEAGKWEATLYSSLNDTIPLPALETALPLGEVYGQDV